MSDTLQAITEGAEIPSVPDVLREILLLTDDPNSSSRDLEKLVHREPGLAAHLLKTANSSYYSPRGKITSVNRAIVMLGFTAVKSIASGLALIDAFNNIPGLNKGYVLSVWKHSLTCAGLVWVLCRNMRRDKQDSLYLAAMVQNVGHLILAQHFGDDYNRLIRHREFPTVEQEQERFRIDHARTGAFLLEEWKFPPVIVNMVRYHHHTDECTDNSVDLKYIEICNHISDREDKLDDFLQNSEREIDPAFLEKLAGAGLSWKLLKENRQPMLDSVDLARKIINT